MSQRYRVPVGVLVLILIGVVALVSIDIALLAQDPARFRADLRLMFVMATLGAALWLAVRLIRTWLEQMSSQVANRLDRLENMAMDTGPLPRARVMGTAVVTASMLPKGVVARTGEGDQPNIAVAGLTPDIIAAGRRISERLAAQPRDEDDGPMRR